MEVGKMSKTLQYNNNNNNQCNELNLRFQKLWQIIILCLFLYILIEVHIAIHAT